MNLLMSVSRNPLVLGLAVALALSGCASKNSLPNSPGELGLAANGAVPGSQQDLTLNVGDRIFFDTDSSAIRTDSAATLDRQAQWLAARIKPISYGKERPVAVCDDISCWSQNRRAVTVVRGASS